MINRIELSIPTRDGLELLSVLYLPKGEGPWPVVLHRWYGKEVPSFIQPERWLEHGYAVVGNEIRDSDGDKGTRFTREDLDGYDVVEWIASQPWSDGNVGIIGKSAGGIAARDAATARPPHLKALVMQNVGDECWGYRANGAVTLAMTAHTRAIPSVGEYPWNKIRDAYRFLPIIDFDIRFQGKRNALWRKYLDESYIDECRETRRDNYEQLRRIDIPTLIVGGWWDYYAGVAFSQWEIIRSSNPCSTKVLIGATNHMTVVPNPDRFDQAGAENVFEEALDLFDGALKGSKQNLSDLDQVKIYTMIANRWEVFDDWPPKNSHELRLYLQRGQSSGLGTLSKVGPDIAPPIQFTYRPDDPVPTLGGNHSLSFQHQIVPHGSFDHSSHEKRRDVLVFSTPPLKHDLQVSGPIKLEFWAGTSARDTDWTATLLDVEPDGTPFNVSMGILRARYRDSFSPPFSKPNLLEPNSVVEYRFELMPTSYVFKAGHQVRLHFSSSNFPLWDRNLNTGEDIATSTSWTDAHQSLYVDSSRPSNLILSILEQPLDNP